MKAGRRLGRVRGRDAGGARTGPGISPEDIAEHNSRVVLALLRSHGALTRQELAAHLNLTEPAITGIVRRLIAAGLVEEGKREVGRRYRAAEFSIRAEGAHALGLWLRPEGADLVVADLKGAVVEERRLALPDLVPAVEALLARWAGGIRGIGLARHPGVDPGQTDLSSLSRLALPLFCLKDTEAAVAGERLLGIGEPEGGFVVILIDETVRAGLVTGGAFFRGVHGRAGEIGGMRPGREECTLDEVAGLASFAAGGAEAGDEAKQAWIARAASRLLDAVVAIAGFVSPEVVLVGGSLPQAVLESIVERMNLDREKRSSYFVAASWIPPVRLSTFPGCGIARGAAMVPFMELLLPRKT